MMMYEFGGNCATSAQRCVPIDGGTLCIPQAQILLDHVYAIKRELASFSICTMDISNFPF